MLKTKGFSFAAAHAVPELDNRSSQSHSDLPASGSATSNGLQTRQPDRRPHYLKKFSRQAELKSVRSTSDIRAAQRTDDSAKDGPPGVEARSMSKSKSAASLRRMFSRTFSRKAVVAMRDDAGRSEALDDLQLPLANRQEKTLAAKEGGEQDLEKFGSELSQELLVAFGRKSAAEQKLLLDFIRDRKIAELEAFAEDARSESRHRKLHKKINIVPKVTDDDIVKYMIDADGRLKNDLREFAVEKGLLKSATIEAARKREQQMHERAARQAQTLPPSAYAGRVLMDCDSDDPDPLP